MNHPEILYLVAAYSCLLAGVVGGASAALKGRGLRFARALAYLGALATFAATLVRGWQAGHLPLFGSYESALSLATFILVVALLAENLTDTRRDWILPLSALVAGTLLLHGATFDPTIFALTISERSLWVDLHAIVAWAAFGILCWNAILATVFILGGTTRGDSTSKWLDTSLSWGFFAYTVMIVSGSFYKFLLFGEAWTFDPIESMALLMWMAYGTLLHLHLLAGWRGRRLASWCVGLFVLLVVSYRGIVYFPAWSTYHIFDMDRRMHLTGREFQGDSE